LLVKPWASNEDRSERARIKCEAAWCNVVASCCRGCPNRRLIMVGGKVGDPSGSGSTSGSFDNSLDNRASRACFYTR
jgi:hypothetical protein